MIPIDKPLTELPTSYIEYAQEILKNDESIIPEFWRNKYLSQVKKNWDQFYKRNKDNFYKDRHWTDREFTELQNLNGKTLMEVGCGVGNFILPLIAKYDNFKAFACDLSSEAIKILQGNEIYKNSNERCSAIVYDLTSDELPVQVELNSLDYISMIFILSAVHPSLHQKALHNAFKLLKPGGVILFRDYGRYDAAELRFKKGHKMDDHVYVRQDGTLACYFDIEEAKTLFADCGFKVKEIGYAIRKTENRRQNLSVSRVFLQAKLEK